MRIGIDIRTLLTPEPTGVSHYTYQLLEQLFKLFPENTYYLFANAQRTTFSLPAAWRLPHVQVVATHYPNKLFNAAIALLRRPRLDVLTARRANAERLDLWFSSHLTFTALSPSVPHIAVVHDLAFRFFPDYSTLRQRLWHRVTRPYAQWRHAARLIAPSESTRRDVITHLGYDPKKIMVIYPGATFPEPGATPSLVQPPYILFLGAREPRKNILGVIAGFEQAAECLPKNCSLVIAGAAGWKNKNLQQRLLASPLKPRITTLGYISETDKTVLIRNAAALMFPSFYEGFGFPVLEAMTLGTPVITSHRASLPEVGGSAVYYVHPHHPEEIRCALERIVASEKVQPIFGSNEKNAAAHFSWEKAARELHAVFVECLASR